MRAYIIGADWFQWMDEPPEGRGDGEDANVGIVDIYDQPYPLLIDAVRDTGPQLNNWHAASAPNGNKDIWRGDIARPQSAVGFPGLGHHKWCVLPPSDHVSNDFRLLLSGFTLARAVRSSVDHRIGRQAFCRP